MPGGQRIVKSAQHKGAIARTHQAFGVGCGRGGEVVEVAAAAGGEKQGLRFAGLGFSGRIR